MGLAAPECFINMLRKKEITAEDIRDMRAEVGKDIEKYGEEYVTKRFWKHYNRNVWLGFFVCLIPVISIVLFFTVPVLPAVIITITMIAFILAIILYT